MGVDAFAHDLHALIEKQQYTSVAEILGAMHVAGHDLAGRALANTAEEDHMPPAAVCEWLRSLDWVGPYNSDTVYEEPRPDGCTRSQRYGYYEATFSMGPDETCCVQLTDTALEAVREEG